MAQFHKDRCYWNHNPVWTPWLYFTEPVRVSEDPAANNPVPYPVRVQDIPVPARYNEIPDSHARDDPGANRHKLVENITYHDPRGGAASKNPAEGKEMLELQETPNDDRDTVRHKIVASREDQSQDITDTVQNIHGPPSSTPMSFVSALLYSRLVILILLG